MFKLFSSSSYQFYFTSSTNLQYSTTLLRIQNEKQKHLLSAIGASPIVGDRVEDELKQKEIDTRLKREIASKHRGNGAMFKINRRSEMLSGESCRLKQSAKEKKVKASAVKSNRSDDDKSESRDEKLEPHSSKRI
ncbi:unnamed protein product [Vicia faba]|uniref:Uncharacterized protein n=1 Tax=Vicia faba TaxID=3906 RepID=A0AAV1BED5_VICFA|nr:unnamed protein product [Vicia faba]